MSRVLPAARTVVVFGVLLQAAGFAKVLVVANFFGAGALLDAYYLALVIPTFFANGVAVGMMQTTFVASYVTRKTNGAADDAQRLARFALTWSVLGLAVVALLSTMGRETAIAIVASGARPETREQLGIVFVPLVWMAPLIGLAECGTVLLNTEGRFGLAAAASLLNAVTGTIVLALWPGAGSWALVWSLAAGLLVQALVVTVAIRGTGMSLRPAMSLPSAPSDVFVSVALPVLISIVLGNVVLSLLQMIAARTGVGAVSSMAYASRLHNALIQAVVLSASAVLLPHFARLIAEKRMEDLRQNLERVFAAALLFSAAALALVAADGSTVVALLLQRGNFTAGDSQVVGTVWLALTVGLLGATWSIFLARLFQAQQRAWVITWMACASVSLNVVLALVLRATWGIVGIAMANSLAYFGVMFLYQIWTHRTLGAVFRRGVFLFTLKVLAANLLVYCALLISQPWLHALWPALVVCLHVVAVLVVNLLLARSAPLRLTPRSIFQF